MDSGEIRSGKAYKLSYDRDLRRPRLVQADKGKVSIIGLGGKLGLARQSLSRISLLRYADYLHVQVTFTPVSTTAFIRSNPRETNIF